MNGKIVKMKKLPLSYCPSRAALREFDRFHICFHAIYWDYLKDFMGWGFH